MARITLCDVTKKFKDTVALDSVSLDIQNNEFFVIFGPAGAGKSTILNTIAGIVDPNEGEVSFDGKIMNCVESAERNVSMVFENYALYPNMSAYDNIASPLRSKRYRQDAKAIDAEVKRVAKMLNIEELLGRLPSQVSNGQKQRIALGRALVRDPNVFLMDEPLAHLDAKLRHAMRKELKTMQECLNTTTVYVTHDFTEAMSLGDRIAVINLGKIQQIGTSDEVYYTPANEFVARLFGEPEINIFPISVSDRDGEPTALLPWDCIALPLPQDVAAALAARGAAEADVGLRSANISYSVERTDRSDVKGTVYSLEPVGNRTELVVKVGDDILRFMAPANTKLAIDSTVYIRLDIAQAIFFDAQTKEYIVRHGEDALRRGESVG